MLVAEELAVLIASQLLKGALRWIAIAAARAA
jgi:hypothetical protein